MLGVDIAVPFIFLNSYYGIIIIINIINLIITYGVYRLYARIQIERIESLFDKDRIQPKVIIDHLKEIDRIYEIITEDNPSWRFSLYAQGLKSLIRRKKDLKDQIELYKQKFQLGFDMTV